MDIKYLQDHVDFTLSEGENLSSLGFKSVQNTQCDNLLYISHVKHNCNDRIIFDISGMEPVTAVYKGLSDAAIVEILSGMAKVFRLVSEKAFLEREYVLIDMDYLYIDSEELVLKFMVLPVSHSDEDGVNDWNSRVVKTIKELLQERDQLKQGCLAEISNAIDEISEVSDGDVLNLINANKNVVDLVIKSFPEKSGDSNKRNNNSEFKTSEGPTLRYRGAAGEFALFITKEIFYIGSSNEMDGTISFNPAISRRHAMICNYEGSIFVEDLGSRNGTYLNHNMCTPGEQYQIHDRDIIRIADMEFLVEM